MFLTEKKPRTTDHFSHAIDYSHNYQDLPSQLFSGIRVSSLDTHESLKRKEDRWNFITTKKWELHAPVCIEGFTYVCELDQEALEDSKLDNLANKYLRIHFDVDYQEQFFSIVSTVFL